MMVTTLLISVPVGLMVISLWGTLYKGAITYNVAMMYAAACMLLLLLGGLTGIPLAVDIHHGASRAHVLRARPLPLHHGPVRDLRGVRGGLLLVPEDDRPLGRQRALPKSRSGSISSAPRLTFWPLFIIGVQGMPRRYWDYSMYPRVRAAAPHRHLRRLHHRRGHPAHGDRLGDTRRSPDRRPTIIRGARSRWNGRIRKRPSAPATSRKTWWSPRTGRLTTTLKSDERGGGRITCPPPRQFSIPLK